MNTEDRLAEAFKAGFIEAAKWPSVCTQDAGSKAADDAARDYAREALAAHEASSDSGLEWSKTLCGGKPVDYETAEAACKSLGEGWRLPTRMELESILDLTRHDPAVDTERFPDTKSEWYWTSTPCAWASSCAWLVSFSNGSALDDYRSYQACVRAVRSLPGQEAGAASMAKVSDAERVIADDLEVAPDVYVVKDENGDSIYCADYERACHEHINDAINEYGDLKARAWKVLRYRLMEMVPCRKCNSMRIAVPAPHDTARNAGDKA